MKTIYRGYRDLKVYQMAYNLAMDIFRETKFFPAEEKYSLVDQIRRSSRSISANISEAWKRRIYRKMFINRVIDAASEAGETEVWLDFAKDCGYMSVEKHTRFMYEYDQVNRMLFGMVDKPDRFLLRR